MATKKSNPPKKKEEVKTSPKPGEKTQGTNIANLPPKLVGALADEVAKTLMQRLPSVIPSPSKGTKKSTKTKKSKKIENAIFLDTSAIIDGRIFDVINLGLLNGVIVLPESILMELKHLADSQDMVKRERGRKGLDYLDSLKKNKKMKLIVHPEDGEKGLEGKNKKPLEVDEKLIRIAKNHKGKIITCDYNLEKKAVIDNVQAINMNALANSLKVIAVPGEALHIKVLHPGKDVTQGVGYLEDGTMIVVEEGSGEVGKMADVVVSRVIQTATGRILFAKKI